MVMAMVVVMIMAIVIIVMSVMWAVCSRECLFIVI